MVNANAPVSAQHGGLGTYWLLDVEKNDKCGSLRILRFNMNLNYVCDFLVASGQSILMISDWRAQITRGNKYMPEMSQFRASKLWFAPRLLPKAK